jgi:asparagine synthase (glutamine-hydrolysing)
VPAGHLLIVDAAAVRVRRYWELRPPAELRYRDAGQYAEHYRDLLYEAVRVRLRSAGPLGALLSGGLDSSSIVCAAQELYRAGRATDRGFATLTFAYGELDCDERDLVEEVRAKYGFDAHHLAYAAATDWLDLAPIGFREAPNMGARAQRDVVGRAAADSGIRVLLTGDWADSCVFGSPIVFDALLRRGRFGELRRYLATYRRLSDESLRTIVAAHWLLPLLPVGAQRRIVCAWLPHAVARHRRRLLPLWMPDRLRDDLLRRQLDLCLAEERGRRFASPAREWEYRLLYPPEIARHPAPWPFEIWRPFADRRLHEFLLAIPPEEKWAPAPGDGGLYAGAKQLARRGLRGILPEPIRARAAKTAFGAVFEGEVARNWGRYATAFGPGSRSEIAARGYVDPDLFWRRLIALRSGNYSGDFMYVLRLVNLETWLRTFHQPRARLVTVDGAGVPALARRAAAPAL